MFPILPLFLGASCALLAHGGALGALGGGCGRRRGDDAGIDDVESLVQLHRHAPDRSAVIHEALFQRDLDKALAVVGDAKILRFKSVVRELAKRTNLSRELRGFIMLRSAGRIMEDDNFMRNDAGEEASASDVVDEIEAEIDEADPPTGPGWLTRKATEYRVPRFFLGTWNRYKEEASEPVSCLRSQVSLLASITMLGLTSATVQDCAGTKMCASDVMELVKYVGYIVRDGVEGSSYCSGRIKPTTLCGGASTNIGAQLLGIVSSSVGLSYKCDKETFEKDLLEDETTLGVPARIFRCSVDIGKGFGYLILYLFRLYRGIDPETKTKYAQSQLAYQLQAGSAAIWLGNAVLSAATGCPEGKKLRWGCAKESTELAAYLANLGAAMERAHDYCFDKYGKNQGRRDYDPRQANAAVSPYPPEDGPAASDDDGVAEGLPPPDSGDDDALLASNEDDEADPSSLPDLLASDDDDDGASADDDVGTEVSEVVDYNDVDLLGFDDDAGADDDVGSEVSEIVDSNDDDVLSSDDDEGADDDVGSEVSEIVDSNDDDALSSDDDEGADDSDDALDKLLGSDDDDGGDDDSGLKEYDNPLYEPADDAGDDDDSDDTSGVLPDVTSPGSDDDEPGDDDSSPIDSADDDESEDDDSGLPDMLNPDSSDDDEDSGDDDLVTPFEVSGTDDDDDDEDDDKGRPPPPREAWVD